MFSHLMLHICDQIEVKKKKKSPLDGIKTWLELSFSILILMLLHQIWKSFPPQTLHCECHWLLWNTPHIVTGSVHRLHNLHPTHTCNQSHSPCLTSGTWEFLCWAIFLFIAAALRLCLKPLLSYTLFCFFTDRFGRMAWWEVPRFKSICSSGPGINLMHIFGVTGWHKERPLRRIKSLSFVRFYAKQMYNHWCSKVFLHQCHLIISLNMT